MKDYATHAMTLVQDLTGQQETGKEEAHSTSTVAVMMQEREDSRTHPLEQQE
jgi:hypothetical protein